MVFGIVLAFGFIRREHIAVNLIGSIVIGCIMFVAVYFLDTARKRYQIELDECIRCSKYSIEELEIEERKKAIDEAIKASEARAEAEWAEKEQEKIKKEFDN